MEHFKIFQHVQPNPDDPERKIDMQMIRDICANGLSECPVEDRCAAWLCLFHIFPADPNEWPHVKDEIYNSYKDYVELFKISNWTEKRFRANVQKTEFDLDMNEKMHIIHGDICRTGRHIFFLPPDDVKEDDPCESELLAPFAKNMRKLERILYIIACCNPTISYMQGFNELLPPLYFVASQGGALFDNDEFMIEAFAFKFLQQLLMSTDIQELYTTADKSSLIMHKLRRFDEIFQRHAPDLYSITKKLELQPLLYCYRWFTLLYAQDYELPTLLIVWDSLFAHFDDLIEFAFYFGVATIKQNEKMLDPDDYQCTIMALQSMSCKHVYPAIKDANNMYNMDHSPPK